MHLGSSGVLTLENVCENMLTHVHKVIHLVVITFEQGWISWWSRGAVFPWLDAGPDSALVRLVSGHSEGGCRSYDRTREVKNDRMCRGRVWSLLMYGDARRMSWPERIGLWIASDHAWPDAFGHDFASMFAYRKWQDSRRGYVRSSWQRVRSVAWRVGERASGRSRTMSGRSWRVRSQLDAWHRFCWPLEISGSCLKVRSRGGRCVTGRWHGRVWSPRAIRPVAA
jgi:hypothetical protein